jgi:hypothetical protein
MTPAKRTALDLHAVVELPAGQAWESDEERASALRALNRVRASIHDDDWSKKVFAFHRLYRVPVGAKGSIHQLDAYRRTLRRRLLEEEFQENAGRRCQQRHRGNDRRTARHYLRRHWLVDRARYDA